MVWPPVLERVKHFLNSNIYIAMDIDAEALNVISSPGSTLFSFSVNLYGSHTLEIAKFIDVHTTLWS